MRQQSHATVGRIYARHINSIKNFSGAAASAATAAAIQSMLEDMRPDASDDRMPDRETNVSPGLLRAWAAAGQRPHNVVMAAMMAQQPLLTRKDAARALKLTPNALNTLIEDGFITPYPGPDRRDFFFPCQITAKKTKDELELMKEIKATASFIEPTELVELLLDRQWYYGKGGYVYGNLSNPENQSTDWMRPRRVRLKLVEGVWAIKLEWMGDKYRWRQEYPREAGVYAPISEVGVRHGWLWFGPQIKAVNLSEGEDEAQPTLLNLTQNPVPVPVPVPIPVPVQNPAPAKNPEPKPEPRPQPAKTAYPASYRDKAEALLTQKGWLNPEPDTWIHATAKPRLKLTLDHQDATLSAEYKPERRPDEWEIVEVARFHEIKLLNGTLKIGAEEVPD